MASPRRASRAVTGDFARLLSLLDRREPVAVQAHDFPDLDAVASAWALSHLLARHGFDARPCHRGAIRSRSLSRLVTELGIALSDEGPGGAATQVIVVDGSPTNGNVSLVPGRLVGVVDHHCRDSDPAAPFIDIEPELASCSTQVYGYWRDANDSPPRDVATALLAGIQSDTDFLSRRASSRDFAAYSDLFGRGDFDLASGIVRTALDLRELGLVTEALGRAEIRDGAWFAWLAGPCGQEVLAVLAEFVLHTEELRLAIAVECGPDGSGRDGAHVSVRSKDPSRSAFALIRRALDGIGSGGGHAHAAGGFIPSASWPGRDALRDRFLSASIPSS